MMWVVAVVAPVGDAAGEHGGAAAFAAFGVGASAQHRVAIDDGRRFHPGAVLAAGRDVAHLVGRAGVHDLRAQAGGVFLALVVERDGLLRQAEFLRLVRVEAQLQVAGEGLELGDLHDFAAVQAELGKHRVHAASLERDVALEGRGCRDGGADVVRLHQPLGAQGLAVAHQQVHGLGGGCAFGAVAHGFFVVGQLHVSCPCFKPRPAARAWRAHGRRCRLRSRVRSPSAAARIPRAAAAR